MIDRGYRVFLSNGDSKMGSLHFLPDDGISSHCRNIVYSNKKWEIEKCLTL
jgi:hypothetical protein